MWLFIWGIVMPKIAKELSATEVKRLASQEPDGAFHFYRVGGVPGLRLRISVTGACYWVLRYAIGMRLNHKRRVVPSRRDLGLGGYPEIPLKLARERARSKRDAVREGIDPVEPRGVIDKV
jgi:hypothetical protein